MSKPIQIGQNVVCGCGSESILHEIIQCPICNMFHHVKCRKAAKCKDCAEKERDDAWLAKKMKEDEEFIKELEGKEEEEKEDSEDSSYDPDKEQENEDEDFNSELD